MNGRHKGRALLFLGNSKKNLDAIGAFLEKLEDSRLFPDEKIKEQKFQEVFDSLADLSTRGIVLHVGVGGKDRVDDGEI